MNRQWNYTVSNNYSYPPFGITKFFHKLTIITCNSLNFVGSEANPMISDAQTDPISGE